MKQAVLAAFALVLAGLFSHRAEAKDWRVDYDHSTLTFTGEQNGEVFNGGFKKFEAKISLDPNHPETGRIDVVIDAASIYAGSDDRDTMLPQPGWFDIAKFPQAHFATTAIHQTSPGHFEAAADLRIKDISRRVVLPFTLEPEGDHWRARGKLALQRTEFQIGQGSFEGEAYVKHLVTVIVDLSAKPLP